MQMPEGRIRVGILGGAGEAAEGHIRGFQDDPRAEVAALWDINEPAARARASEMGVAAVEDTAEALLARGDLDAVVICTPDHLHAAHTQQALLAGKHVLCEKPTATSRQDAAEVVRLVRETGLVFLGGHVYHFRPDYREMVRAYQDGEIGQAWLAEGDYVSDLSELYGPEGRTPWRSDPKNPQDILLGGGCHPLGLLRWALGDEVDEVVAFANHLAEPSLPADDCYVLLLRFSQGTTGRITTAAGSRGKVPDGGHLALRGTAGSLWGGVLYRDDEHRGHDHPPIPVRDFHALLASEPPRVSDTKQVHYWAEQAQHFLDCVEGKATPMTTALDSARVVSALAAGVESARLGQPVRVDNSF
jgi:UDP-N-acetylglucosamine 3-dehydrogenase